MKKLPANSKSVSSEQDGTSEDFHRQRERLVDDLAFLVVREHRHRQQCSLLTTAQTDDFPADA